MTKAAPRSRIPLADRWRAEVARHDQTVQDLLAEAIAGGEGLVERAAKSLGITRGALRRLCERYPAAAELVTALRTQNGYRTGRLGRKGAGVDKGGDKPAAGAAPDDEAPPRF